MKLIISGKSKFMIYQSHGGFLFISRSGNKIKDKDIIKNLKLIEIEFFGRYEDKIRQWNGEVGHFDKFKTIIVKFNGRS